MIDGHTGDVVKSHLVDPVRNLGGDGGPVALALELGVDGDLVEACRCSFAAQVVRQGVCDQSSFKLESHDPAFASPETGRRVVEGSECGGVYSAHVARPLRIASYNAADRDLGHGGTVPKGCATVAGLPCVPGAGGHSTWMLSRAGVSHACERRARLSRLAYVG